MKNKWMNSIIALTSAIIIGSCSNSEEIVTDSKMLSKLDEMYEADTNSLLKREFAKALMSSLNESKSLRDLIKNKSLEKFNNDFEVLYQFIKDEKLENNISVRQLILKNIESESLLEKIEISNPTLTILVPELPENSFSATIWDTESQIPKVAIRLTKSNDVPVINQDGTETIIEAKYTPSFPIIVIKDNERVIIDNSNESKKLTTRKITNSNGTSFKFLDDTFDNSKNKVKNTSRNIFITNLYTEVRDAYNIYSNVDGWQRDYIYYGITPTNPNGPFKYDYQETLASFKLIGDPIVAYNKIADQTGDPRKNDNLSEAQFNGAPYWANYWTGGNFEFKVRIIVNGKSGSGSEIIKYFPASGQDLFNIYYRKESVTNIFGVTTYFYTFDYIEAKEMRPNINIFNWDLEQYSTTIKIDIEEVDFTETTVLTDSRSVEFASNFGLDLSFGTKVKWGLKFGVSSKTTTVSSTQRTFTATNDLLGDVIVNFADDIIIGDSFVNYQTREYQSGWYSISVEPHKVQ